MKSSWTTRLQNTIDRVPYALATLVYWVLMVSGWAIVIPFIGLCVYIIMMSMWR